MIRYLGCLVFFLCAVPACKPRTSGSETFAVGQAGSKNEIVIYFMNTKVFRKNCPSQAAVSAYSNCPGSEKSWDDVKAGLTGLGYDSGKVSKVEALLANWTVLSANSSDVTQHLQFQDLEQIFGIVNSGGSAGFLGGAPAQVIVPPPSTPDSQLATAEVLDAMKKIENQYHMDLNSFVIPCLANDTPHWSDIVSHYYCILGQPRSCFSPKARANTKDLAGYEKAYDDCKNDPDFKWVSTNQPDMFRYIMYSVYTPAKTKTFRQDDQDQVINEFYKITDPENPADCKKRPLRKNESRPAGQHCGKRVVSAAAAVSPAQQPAQASQNSSNGDDVFNDCIDFLVKKGYGLKDVKTYCENSTTASFVLMQYLVQKNYSPRDAKSYSTGMNDEEGSCIRSLVDKSYSPRNAGTYCKGLDSVGVSCLADLMAKSYSPRDARTYCLGVSSAAAQCIKDLMSKSYGAKDAGNYCKGVTEATAGCLLKLVNKSYGARDASTYCKDLSQSEVTCLTNLVDKGHGARNARDTCKR